MLPIGIPEWVSEIIMPVSMGIMALQFVWNASDQWWGRGVALAAVGGAFAIGLVPPDVATHLWPLAMVVLGAALLGAPVFVAMGGIGFLKGWIVPGWIYRQEREAREKAEVQAARNAEAIEKLARSASREPRRGPAGPNG